LNRSAQPVISEDSVLALYHWHIIGLASFCAIATLLVVGLLVQRVRHNRSKEALRTSEERYLLALTGSTEFCLEQSAYYANLRTLKPTRFPIRKERRPLMP
jgi:hypothetical protein